MARDLSCPLPLEPVTMAHPAAAAGELERTLERLAPGLLRYCLARSGSRAEAEDTAQEALTALVDRWRRHGPPDSCRAFAFTVARRRAARAGLKARLRRPLESLGLLASRSDPEAEAVRGQTLRRALAAIRDLPPGEAEAVRLVILGELSVRAAAKLLEIGESALKMRLARARAKLARGLENEHG